MISSLPSWVLEAAALPLAFAQVREDPLLDQWVAEQLGDEAHVILVASGGCTAALLATMANVARLHLVDPNPAQLALARLKLRLLMTSDSPVRLALLGHGPMDAEDRKARLGTELSRLDLPADALGPSDYIARVGPDYAGRYECVFAALQAGLAEKNDDLEAMLRLDDPAEQQRRVDPATGLGRELDKSLDIVMALPNLVHLFGEGATKNPAAPFSRHFADRVRRVLAAFPADCNPYLWQMLKGCYPAGKGSEWLTKSTPSRVPRIEWSATFMAEALAAQPASFDFVHLSNILDWLSPEDAKTTLDVAWRALRPGGWTIIRQLNSLLDIPSHGPMFHWHTAMANDLNGRDRSFFYRALHLGQKL